MKQVFQVLNLKQKTERVWRKARKHKQRTKTKQRRTANLRMPTPSKFVVQTRRFFPLGQSQNQDTRQIHDTVAEIVDGIDSINTLRRHVNTPSRVARNTRTALKDLA